MITLRKISVYTVTWPKHLLHVYCISTNEHLLLKHCVFSKTGCGKYLAIYGKSKNECGDQIQLAQTPCESPKKITYSDEDEY